MGLFQNIIAMWSGTLGNIPAGWQLCDGTNGTPNLEGRFVRGSQGDYAIGDIGGSADHFHTFTSDGHSHVLETGEGLFWGEQIHLTSTTETDSGITVTEPNEPSYYTLAYIMRMP